MKGLKEDLKFNISAQSVKEKLEDYKAFIKEEDHFLATMIRNRIELQLAAALGRDIGQTGKLKGKQGLGKLNSYQTETTEEVDLEEELDTNLMYGESDQAWKKKDEGKGKKNGRPWTKPGDNKTKPGDHKGKPNPNKGFTKPVGGDNLRPCAMACGSNHPFGSLLHCNEYKKKDKEGRSAIITKYRLCIKCLRPPSTKKHSAYVRDCKNTDNCRYCQGPHSHLVCRKPPSVQAFLTGEEDQYEEYDDDETAAIIAMEMAALMEEAHVNLAEGEEVDERDEDDYDEEEDETIGNLMIITE